MNVEEKIKQILSELSGEETVGNDAKLQEDLMLDSLRLVLLLVEIEEKLGIELDESDMNPFDLITVQSVIDMAGKYFEGNKDEQSS